MIIKKLFFSLSIVVLIIGCSLEGKSTDEKDDLILDSGVSPLAIFSFEAQPTEEELNNALLSELQNSDHNRSLVIDYENTNRFIQVTPGLKLVRIKVKTGDRKNAGTDKRYSYLKVTYNSYEKYNGIKTSKTESVTYVLDKKNHDDLNRNTINYYYYLVGGIHKPYSQLLRDYFISAHIGNVSTDGWFCDYITITEENEFGHTRTQELNFNTWVDSPDKPVSNELDATNTNRLYYVEFPYYL